MDRSLSPRGSLATAAVPLLRRPAVSDVYDAIAFSSPRAARGEVRSFREANRGEHFSRSLHDQDAFDRKASGAVGIGHLWLAKIRRDGDVLDLGLVSCRVITTAGVNYLVDAFQGLTNLTNLKYHGVGTGTTAEAVGNTALAAELTTAYSPSSTRPTGSTGEVVGNANAYESAATITVAAGVALTEHGLFSQAAAPGGTLWDRSVFAAVNLAAGESLQATYQVTFPAGG